MHRQSNIISSPARFALHPPLRPRQVDSADLIDDKAANGTQKAGSSASSLGSRLSTVTATLSFSRRNKGKKLVHAEEAQAPEGQTKVRAPHPRHRASLPLQPLKCAILAASVYRSIFSTGRAKFSRCVAPVVQLIHLLPTQMMSFPQVGPTATVGMLLADVKTRLGIAAANAFALYQVTNASSPRAPQTPSVAVLKPRTPTVWAWPLDPLHSLRSPHRCSAARTTCCTSRPPSPRSAPLPIHAPR